VVGCVGPDVAAKKASEPPKGIPCQVVATWNEQVNYTADPTHNGAMTPGLTGRLYLFGPAVDFPMAAEGTLVVELYDETPPTLVPAGGPPPRPRVGADGQPLPLEVWQFDKDTLKRLLQRDMVGWGYTLFLPWGTFRPDVNQVRLKVRYQPVDRTPLFVESTKGLVNGSPPVVTTSQFTPAAQGAQQPPAVGAVR
jgi:hypothetical protein